jgi:hemerythrin-like domain-containing protein
MNRLAHLEAQHRRIERELAALERLAEHVARRGADPLARSEALALASYFDGAAAKHHADEEECLLPLLRSRAAAAGRIEVAAAIDELEREHGAMEALWRRVRAALLDIAAGKEGTLPAETLERFAWLYRRHIEREDLLILPFAREGLTGEDLAGLPR